MPYTDVGWSPYFPLISGLVTEIGGLCSHGIFTRFPIYRLRYYPHYYSYYFCVIFFLYQEMLTVSVVYFFTVAGKVSPILSLGK